MGGLADLAKLSPEVIKAFQQMNKAGINTPQKLQEAAKTQAPFTPVSSTIQYSTPQPNLNPPKPVSPATGQAVGTSAWGKPLTGRHTPEQQEAFRSDPKNQQVINQIRDEAIKRYGMTSDYTVLGLANKVQNEGMPLEQAMQMLQQGYGYEGNQDLRRAADLTAIQYDPMENALRRAQDEARRDYDQSVQTQNLYGSKADKSLEEIYSQLSKSLGTNADDLRAVYDRGAQQIEGGYDRALQAATGAVTGHQEQLGNLAQQLGVEEGLQSILPQIAEQLGFQTGAISADRGNALANINTLGTQQEAISRKGVGDASKEGAQNRAGIVSQVLGNIGRAGIQFGEESRDIRGQMTDLAGTRSAALRTALEDVQLARSDRERQIALDNLAAELQRGSLDVQRGQLDLSRQELELGRQGQNFNQDLQRQEMALRKRQLEAQLATPPGAMTDYERAQIQLEYDKLNAEMSGLTGSGSSGPQMGGAPGLNQLFNTPNNWGGGTDWWSQITSSLPRTPEVADQRFKDSVYSIIDSAHAASAGDRNLAYQKAMEFMLNPAFQNLNQDLLRQAIDISFKRF